ncbi:MAG: DUF4286 family protein, partial [Gemmatimonadaceae bacterium]|nr:DUF4286 family protein [Gemmatimonadaceae bacterium]
MERPRSVPTGRGPGPHDRRSRVITYEVTAAVRDDLRGRYEVYMRERHIPDVLQTGLFLGAQLLRTDDGR